MRRALALALTLTVFLAAPAAAGGPDHVVKAAPKHDGQRVHRADVQVSSTGADTLDSTNLALANPHDCTGCEGIAVAFQAVIATGNPSTMTPRNVAAAVNSNCTGCGAFAFAYQYVVTTDGPAHLSDDARARIADIRAQADDAVDAGLPYDQLDARLKDLATQFKAAVDDGLQSTGEHPHDGRDAEREDREGD
jgi:putative peptide zinc metalloprotease protein